MRHQQSFGRLSSLGFVAMVFALLGWPITGQADDDRLPLAGHWTFSADSRDLSGNDNHAENHGAQLGVADPAGRHQAARLDGRANYFNIPTNPSLRVGSGDFSLTAWVHVAKELDDVAGDIISKFDPATRTGFELSIRHNVGVTDSQANYRQLSFGIDQGRLGKWVDRGRPGNSLFAFSMTVFQDDLYIGTCEPGRDEAGHVYRFDGQASWIDCGAPDRANSISSLIVHAGHLYAASCKYRLSGSSLTESTNVHPGGHVFRYAGDQKWVDCGKLGDAESIFGMVVFRGDLYASTLYSAGLYRYDGGTRWTHCGSPAGKRVEALTVFNGAIYCSGFDEGAVYRYDGTTWEHLGNVGDNTQTYGFAAYQSKLYVSSWRSGRVYRYEGDRNWTDVGRLGNELESMPLCIYNGKMYSGTLPLAEVYRYDGGQTWTSLGRIDTTPDVRYRRAWSMAVYRGQLFVGTLPSGRVQSIEAGKVVTYDRELAPGWRHVAAVKERNRLKLYVDGERVASSSQFDAGSFSLDNDRPLLIGFGQHDYFNGRLSDVRLYRRAVTKEEIAQIMASIQGQ